MISRRALLGGAAVAALGRPIVAEAAVDVIPPLERLLVMEQHAALAYRTAGGGELTRIGDQEHDHALALATLLGGLTVHAPDAPTDPEALRGPAADVARGDGDAAIALERALLKAHSAAIRGFKEPEMLRSIATIMASHGQHLVVLYERLGRDPIDSGR